MFTVDNIKNLKDELGLPFELRDYQWQGVSCLLNNKSILLADEMGLGKTVQVAVSLAIIQRKKPSIRSLIVVPASLKYNWEQELKLWSPSLSLKRVKGGATNRWATFRSPFNVIIASYDDLRNEMMEAKLNEQYDLVVLDEAQYIKNPNSKMSRSCKQIERQRSWALTGTPVENKKSDLVSIFNFLEFGLINRNMRKNQILKKMEQKYLRRKKEDVLQEMPPIIEQEIKLILKGNQKHAYQSYYYESKNSILADDSKSNLLARITKLKQLCNYDDDSNESIKMDTLAPIVEDVFSNNSKVIIFSQYVNTLEWIAGQLNAYNAKIFHGGLDANERNKMVQDFEECEDGKVLLISLRAGGVGLNLKSADTVVLFDRWWNPALEKQAIARSHRFGRENPLHVIKFLISDTIEENIFQIINDKEELFEKYIEDIDQSSNIRLLDEIKKVLLS